MKLLEIKYLKSDITSLKDIDIAKNDGDLSAEKRYYAANDKADDKAQKALLPCIYVRIVDISTRGRISWYYKSRQGKSLKQAIAYARRKLKNYAYPALQKGPLVRYDERDQDLFPETIISQAEYQNAISQISPRFNLNNYVEDKSK
jgi:hypothetical protein